MITFYDVPGNTEDRLWNFIPWRARYVFSKFRPVQTNAVLNSPHLRYSLAFKGVAFQTTFIEYPEIEPISKSIGAPPTGTRPDGSPKYTIPFLYDDATQKAVSDSLKIAEYLDATYPDVNRILVPAGTSGLQRAFMEAVFEITGRWMRPLGLQLLLGTGGHTGLLSGISTKHLASAFGLDLNTIPPPLAGKELEAQWLNAEKEMEKIASWYDGDNLFIMGGDQPCFADFAMAAVFVGQRSIRGSNSKEWAVMRSWNGGRWGRLIDAFKAYESTKDFYPKSK